MNPDSFDHLMLRAIEHEIAARDFYKEAAGRVTDRGVKDIFEELSRQEDRHREILETFRFNPSAQVAFERVDDFGLAEEADPVAISVDLSPKEAYALAMKREQAAMETYLRWAQVCQDPEIKQVYEELAEMERGHKARLEELFLSSAFPEVW